MKYEQMIPVSWLARWAYCPRQVYLEAVLGIKPTEDKRMVEGAFVHSAMAKVFEKHSELLLLTKPYMQRDDFIRSFKHSYLSVMRDVTVSKISKLRAFGLNPVDLFDKYTGLLLQLAETHARAAAAFAATFGMYGKRLANNQYPRFETNVFIEAPLLMLKGELDIVEAYKDTKVPIELKTSKPPYKGVWAADQIQLGAYAMMLSELEKRPIHKGYVYYLNSGRKVPIVLNPFLEEEVILTRDKVLQMLKNSSKPKRQEKKDKCKQCSYHFQC